MVRPDDRADPAAPAARLPDWLGVALLCACSVLAAILELMFIPLYAGTVLIPAAVVGAVVGNALLPRLAWALVPSMRAAALPLLAWLVVMLAVVLLPGPKATSSCPAAA